MSRTSVDSESNTHSSLSSFFGYQSNDNYDEYEEDDMLEPYPENEAFKTSSFVTTPYDCYSINSIVAATTQRIFKGGHVRRHLLSRSRSQRLRDRHAKLYQMGHTKSTRSARLVYSSPIEKKVPVSNSYSHDVLKPSTNYEINIRRCDSATNLTTSFHDDASIILADNEIHGITVPQRKQGIDFLVEIDEGCLSVFGQGALRHALTGFSTNTTHQVRSMKFNYTSFDNIIPFFGKLRRMYPSVENFYFRANNICTLSQLDGLSDLQGLTTLFVSNDGNPIVEDPSWINYATYRLSHWGLKSINGKDVSPQYHVDTSVSQVTGYESLGFLALSCLPQSAVTPLARRLHALHCFCCGSSSNFEDSINKPTQHESKIRPVSPLRKGPPELLEIYCGSWNNYPLLLDVIGKEALGYCPLDVHSGERSNFLMGEEHKCTDIQTDVPTSKYHGKIELIKRQRKRTIDNLVHSGMRVLEKADNLEKEWPMIINRFIQDVIMDYRFSDAYIKKQLS